MKITDLLKPVSIQLNVAPPKSKTEAIEILADLMEKSGNLNNKEEYLKAVIAREESGSTGLGDGWYRYTTCKKRCCKRSWSCCYGYS